MFGGGRHHAMGHSPADLAQTAPPKGQIARFLHNHKDDGDYTPRRVVL
jgi:hypothetical protein